MSMAYQGQGIFFFELCSSFCCAQQFGIAKCGHTFSLTSFLQPISLSIPSCLSLSLSLSLFLSLFLSLSLSLFVSLLFFSLSIPASLSLSLSRSFSISYFYVQVKLQYRKAMLVVHPDRCSALTTETKFIAKRIFEGITQLFSVFIFFLFEKNIKQMMIYCLSAI